MEITQISQFILAKEMLRNQTRVSDTRQSSTMSRQRKQISKQRRDFGRNEWINETREDQLAVNRDRPRLRRELEKCLFVRVRDLSPVEILS